MNPYYVNSDILASALSAAIKQRSEHEKSIGYTTDSAMLAQYKDALEALQKGMLKIKPNNSNP